MPTKNNRENDFETPDLPDDLVNLDYDYSLFELTHLFWAYYRYHNEDSSVSYDYITNIDSTTGRVNTVNHTLPRFPALRRIEASKLGARPYMGGKGIAAHLPNLSFGYMKMILQFLRLPYKAVFNEVNLAKVQINKKLFDESKLTKKQKEELKLESANNPNIVSNLEVSDDVSDVFSQVMRLSKPMQRCFNAATNKIVQDGGIAFLHNDVSWDAEPVALIDLITEPQANWDSSSWGTFFVLKKMTAQEAVNHIRNETKFWNTEALKWALENATQGRGIISGTNNQIGHGTVFNEGASETPTCGENFAVKSYYEDKSDRIMNLGSYYGNMLVVEAYYINKNKKVEKVIFFPSEDFLNLPLNNRLFRDSFVDVGTSPASERSFSTSISSIDDLDDLQEFSELSKADVLFRREFDFDSLHDVITVIPIDPTEESLERQRGFGHELFSPIEMTMRLDASILNIGVLSGIPFYKNRQQGTDAEQLSDMEIAFDGNMVELGNRDFIETPFVADLGSLLNLRSMILQHIASKAFLGGLDGTEEKGNGRGAELANLRLVRDGRVHKHNIEDFAQGLTEFYKKTFRNMLKEGEDSSDVRISQVFFAQLNTVLAHNKDLLTFDKKDIIEDTGLPYWMDVAAVRNGASHFGPAELHLYSQIKQIFGDGLDQRQLSAFNRTGIKSLLGAQDAISILGDPKDNFVVDQEQVYRAQDETASLIGSVDAGAVSFVPIPVLADKDDHVIHLSESHNPKAQEIIERLQEVEVTPQVLQEMSEAELESRINLILKLAALSSHISLHLEQLDRFGRKRSDINQLKEDTNFIVQASEGLLSSLQINLRALEQKRADQEARLQNLSPENQVEQQKQELELMKIQAKRAEGKEKLELANKIADNTREDKRIQRASKERDRMSKERAQEREDMIKLTDIQTKAATELEKTRMQARIQEKNNNNGKTT